MANLKKAGQKLKMENQKSAWQGKDSQRAELTDCCLTDKLFTAYPLELGPNFFVISIAICIVPAFKFHPLLHIISQSK